MILNTRISVAMAAAVLLAVTVISIRSGTGSRQDAAQARQEARASDGYASAAKDAVATVSARSDAEAELKDVVAEAAKDIVNAEGSDQPIPPAARAAAFRAACRLPDYRLEPACQVQPAHP